MNNPSTSDMDDDQAAEAAEAEARKRRIAELQDWRWLAENPTGARILRKILERCGPLRQTFDAQSERLSCLRAGERDVGLWILSQVTEAHPEAIAPLLVYVQKPNRLDGSQS